VLAYGRPLTVEELVARIDAVSVESTRKSARGLLSRAPIAVRVGTATFALRLFEAACIRVCPEQPQLP